MPSFDQAAGHAPFVADGSGFGHTRTSKMSSDRQFPLQNSREAINGSFLLSSSDTTPQAAHSAHDFQPRERPERYVDGDVPHNYQPPASAATGSPPRPPPNIIEPSLFDALTKNPDDPSVVRFSPSTGAIIAATPARLIAHITSPSFLDYELLSDFFLTFRAYLSTSDLLYYLIARLQWAVSRVDDFGRIVRVRTFVALRHWILNYFVDDFLPDYRLRTQFCRLVNTLDDELRRRDDGGGGDLKIVGELKKCWRRTCALYWDVPDSAMSTLADDRIYPGGRLGSRDSQEKSEEGQVIDESVSHVGKSVSDRKSNDAATALRRKVAGWAQHAQQSSIASALRSFDEAERPNDGISGQSVQTKSSTLPLQAASRPDMVSGLSLPLLHPATTTQTPLMSSIAGQPFASRTRSSSFSDALRDRRSSSSGAGSLDEGTPLVPNLTFPGSLVRGAQFQPASPYLDSIAPSSPTEERIRFEEEELAAGSLTGFVKPSYLQPPGVKKFLGNVKRVLSSRQSRSQMASEEDPTTSAQHFRKSSDSLTGPSFTASQKRSRTRLRIPPRIDILAAGVNESFRTMIKEQGRVREEKLGYATAGAAPEPLMDALDRDAVHLRHAKSPRSGSGWTVGDRPIVIMEDAEPDVSATGSLQGASAAPSGPSFALPHSASVLSQTESVGGLGNHNKNPGQYAMFTDSANSLQHRNRLTEEHLNMSSDAATPVTGLPPKGERDQASQSSFSTTRSLRRYNSYQSGMGRSLKERAAGTSLTETIPTNPRLTHQLRRRPGGNLRAVDNVQDLEPLKRSRSTGSMSNYAHSISNSLTVYSAAQYAHNDEVRHTGLPPNNQPKRISLVATHSSQPNMRASFQAEVSKLAALPDDDDAGGIEAALLKLEGRYQKPVRESRSQLPGPKVGHLHGITDKHLRQGAAQVSAVESEDSYSPVPHLDRRVSNVTMRRRKQSNEWVQVPRPKGSREGSAGLAHRTSFSDAKYRTSGSSAEHVEGTQNVRQITPNVKLQMGEHGDAHDALSMDDTYDTDDLSSELSTETPGDSIGPGMRSFYHESRIFPSNTNGLLPYPAGQTLNGWPLTTQSEVHPALRPTYGLTIQHGSDVLVKGSGKAAPSESSYAATSDRDTSSRNGLKQTAVLAPQTAHLPFILAYQSETLAQQFTMIEKDALDEIDWKELIELRWKQNATPVRNWVEYLKTQEPRGVDVAITRFNLMAKWALSECVLTSNVDERAKCIVKYIHIAAHARRLRNYATMLQITMALSSSDCSRLTKTWSLVPAADVRTLRTLETLIQPMRNFHNLRVEMEKVTGEEGCIPFIGKYTSAPPPMAH